MKSLVFGLSFMSLIMGFSILSLAESTTDAEVVALVNAEKAADEAKLPAFKNNKPEKKEVTTSDSAPWIKMFGSLALVLILIGGGVYGFKKLPQAQKLAGRVRMIQVLGQHHLGAKKTLAVVRVAGETVLIGVTDHNISLLKTLSLLDEDLPNQKFTQTLSEKLNPEDEFSMKGIKDIINKSTRAYR